MILIEEGPKDGRSAVLRALRAANGAFASSLEPRAQLTAAFLASKLDDLQLALPIPVCVAPSSSMNQRTKRISFARRIGWQYALIYQEQIVALAELSIDSDKRSRVTSFVRGRRCDAFSVALKALDEAVQERRARGELRLLWVPEEGHRALWLRNKKGRDQLFFFGNGEAGVSVERRRHEV